MCHVVGCGGGRADSPSPNTRLERGRSGGVGEGGDGSAGWWGRGDTTSVSLAAGGGGSSRVGEFGDASRAAGLAVVWAPAPAMARPRESWGLWRSRGGAAVGTLVGESSGPRRFTMVTENVGEPCAEAGEVFWAESPGALGESLAGGSWEGAAWSAALWSARRAAASWRDAGGAEGSSRRL